MITMGCGDVCPYVPGVRRDDWPLEDPRGQPIERVRGIRDELRARVEACNRSRGREVAPRHYPRTSVWRGSDGDRGDALAAGHERGRLERSKRGRLSSVLSPP